MSRPLAPATAALLSLACAGGPAAPQDRASAHPPMRAPAGDDSGAPSLDAHSAAGLRERALTLAPPGVSAHIQVQCGDPAAWCGFETLQPDTATLAGLLAALEQACGAGPLACAVFLESIDAGADGQKHARIAIHPADAAAAPPRPARRTPGALDAETAAGVVADVSAALPEGLRGDLDLRCSTDLGCSLRTEQVDNEAVSLLLTALADRCGRAEPAPCAVWLTDLYRHPDSDRKVANIALTTAN